jgi:crotonobetaine/carnitine-CoA ligase
LHDRAEASPSAPFVTFAGETLSFATGLGRAEQAAAALAELGVAKGDHVAVMLPNCLEFLDIWFGCALLGAVLVPVNLALKGDGLRYILEHSDAKVVFADESVVESIEAAGAAPALGFVRGRAPGWRSVAELLSGSYAAAPDVRVAPEDLASILYTSGTTGMPKGVMNCHNAYLTTGYEFAHRHVAVRADDVFYTSLPLFHINAQMLTTMGSLVSGRPMVLSGRFSASRFVADIREHDATIFNYIGAMLTMIYKQPAREDDADNPARLAIGAAASAELWRAFEQRFGVTILEIYGLTETATYCVGNPPDAIEVGAIGVPVSWAEVDIHRADGVPVTAGETGEIVIRSKRPHVLFSGYYKNPAATEQAMTAGWFRSGDRGRRTENGYLQFVDRMKDCIRRRGENISSFEVERVVNAHPLVAESAAVGVPSELGEEEVMIVVVPTPDAQPAPRELIDYCSTRLASFMVPRYVKFQTELPKTATERVQKYDLRRAGVAGAWDSASASASA